MKPITFILIFSFFISKPLPAQYCKSCQKYEDINVCFVAKKMGIMTPFARLSESKTCGLNSVIFRLENEGDFKNQLAVLTNSCFKINKLIFFSHGRNNELIDLIKSEEWKNYQQFSCLLNDNAVVDTRACNIGNGCDGALQMYRISKALFYGKPGKVISPTFYTFSISDRPTSLFGIPDRQLNYEPKSKNTIDFFNETEELINTNNEVISQCLKSTQELKEISAKIKHQIYLPQCNLFYQQISEIISKLELNLELTFETSNLSSYFDKLDALNSLGFQNFRDFKKTINDNVDCSIK